MQTNDILSAVPDVLTEAPVSFTLDIQPRNGLHRWLQKNKYLSRYFPTVKSYEIRPITYGNLQRISKLLLSVDVRQKSKSAMDLAYKLMNEHAGTVAEILAIAIHNKKSLPASGLKEELLFNITPQESMSLLLIVLKQMSIQNFLATMISMRGLQILDEEKKQDEKS